MNTTPDTEISGTVTKLRFERDRAGSVLVAYTRASDGHTGKSWLRLDHEATEHLAARTAAPLDGSTAQNPWPHVRALVAWLDTRNGTGQHERSIRLLKLAEEVGEVSAAYIGTTGQNPRKGTTHTPEDVADELCDVIVTAMVALHSFTDQPAQHLADKLTTITRRAHLGEDQ